MLSGFFDLQTLKSIKMTSEGFFCLVDLAVSALATKALIIFSSDGVEKARAITGDDGLYYIRDVPEGRYSVTISYRDITREYPGFVIPSAKYDFDI